MRALALLLILANLGFLGWSQLVDVRRAPAAVPARVGVGSAPRLVLSTEAPPPAPVVADSSDVPASESTVDPAVALVQPAPATSPVDDMDVVSCVSVGAFRDLTEAVQASAALQTAGYSSRQRVEQGEVWLGYWVSLQNLPTREEAERALVQINQSGITDAYILPGAESANVISLGVFTDAARAQRRVEEIRALGLQPQLADRRRAGSVYWVDVDLPSPGAMFDTAVLQTQPGRIVRLEFRPCPEGTAAPQGGAVG